MDDLIYAIHEQKGSIWVSWLPTDPFYDFCPEFLAVMVSYGDIFERLVCFSTKRENWR